MFVVFNNGRYEILRRFLRHMDRPAARAETYVGLDLEDPAVNSRALARSLGVEGASVNSASQAGDSLGPILARSMPYLLEVVIARE